MKNKIQLGPVQKAWLHNLRTHPERKTINYLGKQLDGVNNYCACVLGEFHLTFHRVHSLPLPFDKNGYIVSNNGDYKLLAESKDYGFHSCLGAFSEPINANGITHYTISGMNDNGILWSEIADYIEINPNNVFTKSV